MIQNGICDFKGVINSYKVRTYYSKYNYINHDIITNPFCNEALQSFDERTPNVRTPINKKNMTNANQTRYTDPAPANFSHSTLSSHTKLS